MQNRRMVSTPLSQPGHARRHSCAMRPQSGSAERNPGMESKLRSLFRAAQRWDASEREARDARSAESEERLSAHGIDSEDVFVRRALRILRVDMEGVFMPRQRARLASLSKVRSHSGIAQHCRVRRPHVLSRGPPPAPPWSPTAGLARLGHWFRGKPAWRQGWLLRVEGSAGVSPPHTRHPGSKRPSRPCPRRGT